MAVDLPAERDLSLIFDRDDVIDAFSGHCSSSHYDAKAYELCRYCQQLRVTLANAIIEWLALVEQDRAALPAPALHGETPLRNALREIADGCVSYADCGRIARAALSVCHTEMTDSSHGNDAALAAPVPALTEQALREKAEALIETLRNHTATAYRDWRCMSHDCHEEKHKAIVQFVHSLASEDT